MLASARQITLNERVFRVTQEPKRAQLIRQLHTDLGEGTEFAEAVGFMQPMTVPATTIVDMVTNSFRIPAYPGRFSDGSYPVLYTARHHRTASREYGNWSGSYFHPTPGNPYRIRLVLISCLVQGPAKDVRRFLPTSPWLIDNNHAQCQALGAAARAEGLHGLVAPSARHRPKGVTVPMFVRASVSAERQEGEVVFTINAGGPVSFRKRATP